MRGHGRNPTDVRRFAGASLNLGHMAIVSKMGGVVGEPSTGVEPVSVLLPRTALAVELRGRRATRVAGALACGRQGSCYRLLRPAVNPYSLMRPAVSSSTRLRMFDDRPSRISRSWSRWK